MAKATPILFLILNCSLNNRIPIIVDIITIPTLLMVNKVELSKSSVCRALIKNIIEK